MSKARDLADLLSGGSAGIPTFGGSSGIRVPNGTTAERPSLSASQLYGTIRYNETIEKNEVYDGSGWVSIASPPVVSSVTDGNIGEAVTTQTIEINGSNIEAGATAILLDSNGVEYAPTTTTRNSSTQITLTYTGSDRITTSAAEPLDVKVTNPSGLSATLDNAVNVDAKPVWTTSAGVILTVYDQSRTNASVTVVATDPEGGSITYSAVSGMPTGMSINSSTGVISGTPNAVATDTNHSIVCRATDSENNTTDRTFIITVKAPQTATFTYTGSDQTFSVPSGVTNVSMRLWGAAGGGGYGENYSDKGGPGGFTTISSCTVTPGDTLKIQVGQGGYQTSGTSGPLSSSRPYPWGGRPSPRSGYYPGYGGGRSAVFKSNSVSAANALAVAGGGGGAGGLGWSSTLGGRSFCGGSGGGSTGGQGKFLHDGNQYGNNSNLAGTQSGIGTNGLGVQGAGVEAAQFKGGDAGNPEGTYSGHGGNVQGGGGDGWYGGRASNYSHSGAGGGSGYINTTYASGTTSAQTQTHTNSADSPSNPVGTSDSYYANNAGKANSNGTGNNGYVVIIY